MSELRDVIQEHNASLAAQLRGTDEFDLPITRKVVRRKRRTRAALTGAAAVVGVTVVATGAWAGIGLLAPAPIATPSTSATPSPSATPSATPSGTPTPSPTLSAAARRADYTDAELLAMAENPTTGEVWLGEAQPIDPPRELAEAVDPTTWGERGWYRVGERDGRTILVYADDSLDFPLFFETNPDGTDPIWVTAPAPQHVPPPADDALIPVPQDADTYYESLAIFSEWTAPDGLLVMGHEPRMVIEASEERVFTPVREFGGSTVVRVEEPAESLYEDAAIGELIDDRAVGVTYAIQYPFGLAVEAQTLSPLAEPFEFTGAGVGWAPRPQHVEQLDMPLFSDFLDKFCAYVPTFWTLVTDEDPAQWTEVGTSRGSSPVYTPTPQNPLAPVTYEAWKAWVTGNLGDGSDPVDTLTLETYLAGPAIIGTPAADGSGWWVAMHENFSMRGWC